MGQCHQELGDRMKENHCQPEEEDEQVSRGRERLPFVYPQEWKMEAANTQAVGGAGSCIPHRPCCHDLLRMHTVSLYLSILIILEHHFGYSYPYPNPYPVAKLSNLGHTDSTPNTPESILRSIDLFWKYPQCLITV